MTTTTRPSYEQPATDDLELLLATLPPHVRQPLDQTADNSDLLEVVLDLGRLPEARYPGREVILSEDEVSSEDLEYVVSRIGDFGDDNRAGIPRTLHRISAIRNRKSMIVGLTCRVGRSVLGTMDIIRDFVEGGKSTLILGKPGVGKTTMLREVARVLADDFKKRVIIVDTSNEIAGDGDIPHPGIGRARRMQVPTPSMQHAVMIEAVENHMPEVIVIDEIGTELEADAARTIAERGVQLVGTAHGNVLENIMMNPTLADLIGGIQPVTLGDEEARRRGTQKTVLERKGPPTFEVLVEMQERQKVAVHRDVAETVDAVLRGQPVAVEVRQRLDDGTVERRLEVPRRFSMTEERNRRTGRGRESDPDGHRLDRGDRIDRDVRDLRGTGGERTDREFRGAERRSSRSEWSSRAIHPGRDLHEAPRLGPYGWTNAQLQQPSPAREASLAGSRRRWEDAPGLAAGERSVAVTETPYDDVDGADGEDEDAIEHALAPGGEGTGRFGRTAVGTLRPVKLYAYGVNRDRLDSAITGLRLPVTVTKDVREADVVMTLKNYYRKHPGPVRDAEDNGKPVLILRSNTSSQVQQALEGYYGMSTANPPRDLEDLVIRETQDAIQRVMDTAQPVEMPPQNAYVRRLQHQLAEQFQLGSRSTGREPHRRVRLFKPGLEQTQRWP